MECIEVAGAAEIWLFTFLNLAAGGRCSFMSGVSCRMNYITGIVSYWTLLECRDGMTVMC
jgi:hypothetical protein